jgi:glyoxalase family protein
MEDRISGIHHITAISGNPQENVDFYCGVLGLRLVKRTVNFDDPETYHLYYGDERGSPGTIMTFFPWVNAYRGRRGTGQVTVTSFSIPSAAMGFWIERFKRYNIAFEGPYRRFDEEVLSFHDPDDLELELVAHARGDSGSAWQSGSIPEEKAIHGFFGATMVVEGFERTGALLTETMGMRLIREEGNRFRFQAGDGGSGTLVDLLCRPDGLSGVVARGTVHHIAWRASSYAELLDWRELFVRQGFNVTPDMDRNYFRSIYFREPGGVLFEIATDPPGFTVDETLENLGKGLKLPSWLEAHRERIESRLPSLRLPGEKELA